MVTCFFCVLIFRLYILPVYHPYLKKKIRMVLRYGKCEFTQGKESKK